MRTDQADGSYWEYEYDDRDRLTEAVRSHPGGNIQARYAYTYDAGDNMVSKTEPYLDDFNDGSTNGWTISGSMSAASNYLESTGTGAPVASLSSTDASNEALLRYRINDTSDSQTRAYVVFRFTDWNNYEWVRICPSSINIGKVVSGTATPIASGSVTSSADIWYNLRVVADGASVQVYRWADGAMPALVCSTTSSPNQSTSSFKIAVNSGYLFDFDDVRILADDLSNTTTFAVNNANELTSMTDPNGTTTFTYDAWGRMTGKARGSFTATYGYRYGDKLQSVASSFPGEGNVTYKYGGDGKRHQTTSDSTIATYRWRAWRVISEDDGDGILQRTYIGHTYADVRGSNLSTGIWSYYSQDYLGSTRHIRAADKSSLGVMEFAPYGGPYQSSGATATRQFCGHEWDQPLQSYYTPYRCYSPVTSRWISRDPLGFFDGPNLYGYVRGQAISQRDAFGLSSSHGEDDESEPEPGEIGRGGCVVYACKDGYHKYAIIDFTPKDSDPSGDRYDYGAKGWDGNASCCSKSSWCCSNCCGLWTDGEATLQSNQKADDKKCTKHKLTQKQCQKVQDYWEGIRKNPPDYNLITNNCQTVVDNMPLPEER